MRTYGQEVRAAMRQREVSLREVGKAAGTGKGYICGICTGAVNPPSPRMTRKIARFLGLDADRLLSLAVLEKMPRELSLKALRNVLDEKIDEQSSKAELAKEAS